MEVPLATAVAAPIETHARPQHAVLVGALAFLGAAATVFVALHAGAAPLRAPAACSTLRPVGVAFCGAVGSYPSWRRPAARFGLSPTLSGVVFAIATLTASHH